MARAINNTTSVESAGKPAVYLSGLTPITCLYTDRNRVKFELHADDGTPVRLEMSTAAATSLCNLVAEMVNGNLRHIIRHSPPE